jgi:predicted nucleic acid-binding protein
VRRVFADTFYWIALTLPGDAAYARAQQVTDDLMTTEEVLTEYLTFFCASPEYLRREVAANVTAMLSGDADVRIIPQSHDSFIAGFELYRARPDKGYSLTDCISMQTMRKEGLTEVLTNDRHFEQEGFRALFRDS